MNSINGYLKNKRKGFSLAEMLMSLLIVSICLAATMPVITQKRLTGGSGDGYWMSSNNSDIYYGLGNSAVTIGTSKKPTSGAKLSIASNSSSVTTPVIAFLQSDGTSELGRISFDTTRSTAIGFAALKDNSTGQYNTGVGGNALANNTTGQFNTGLGQDALFMSTTGDDNTAVGSNAMQGDTMTSDNTGSRNTALGSDALVFNSTGNNNTALGESALGGNKTGSGNIGIGHRAGPSSSNTGISDKLYIDNAQNDSSSFIYGDMASGVRKLTINGSLNVTGTIQHNGSEISYSDIRLKNVKGLFTDGLDKIVKIQPKNYIFKKDKKKQLRTGVIAQDLQKIFPNSVVKLSDGYLGISQDEMFYAMINSIKELNAKNEKLSAENKALKAKLNNIDERLSKLEGSAPVQKTQPQNNVFQTIKSFFAKLLKSVGL